MTRESMTLRWKTLLDPVQFFALGLGSGLVPKAPGTAGSLVGLVPAWLLLNQPLGLRVAVVAVLFAIGVWLCGESARRLGVHDHPAIVFDEVVGVLATSLVMTGHPVWLIAAFALFRVFDIVKPWPVRDVDHRLHGGVGIMLDDLMAAAYAGACLWGLERLVGV